MDDTGIPCPLMAAEHAPYHGKYFWGGLGLGVSADFAAGYFLRENLNAFGNFVEQTNQDILAGGLVVAGLAYIALSLKAQHVWLKNSGIDKPRDMRKAKFAAASSGLLIGLGAGLPFVLG